MNKLKKLKQSETITLFQFLQMEDYTMKHEKTIYEKISLQILKLSDEELECGIDLKSLMEENGFIINIDFEDYEIEPGNYYLGSRTCFYDVNDEIYESLGFVACPFPLMLSADTFSIRKSPVFSYFLAMTVSLFVAG